MMILLCLLVTTVAAQSVDFLPPIHVPVQKVGMVLALGDFNGDNHLDVAVAASQTTLPEAHIVILLGDGTGQLSPPSPIISSDAVNQIKVGDFNGDQFLDLVITTGRLYALSILLGDGKGAFAAPVSILSRASSSLLVADLNGDEVLDLVSGSSILLGLGTGAFFLRTRIEELGTSPSLGDFNGDGILDFVSLNNLFVSDLVLSLGEGNERFTSATVAKGIPEIRFLESGDFNGDGLLDLGAVHRIVNAVSIFFGDGRGVVSVPISSPLPWGENLSAMRVADFDNDGVLDIAARNSESDEISVLLGDGAGHFAEVVFFAVGRAPSALAVGDLNGDGKVDLVTVNAGSADISVLLNATE